MMVREQRGVLQGASLLVKPREGVAAVGATGVAAEARAYGMSRAELAKHGGNMGGYGVLYDGDLPQGQRERERNDLRGDDAAAALNPLLPQPVDPAPIAPRAKMGGVAGASMRSVNDRMEGLLADTHTSGLERRQQERDSSSRGGVGGAFAGGGYFERDTQVRYRPRQGEHAESYDVVTRDSVARQNLLQPDLNEGVAAEARARAVNDQQRRLSVRAPPFGTESAPRDMVTTALANDRRVVATTHKVLAEKGRAPEVARMHHPWLCEPHEVTAVQEREFIKAGNISEYHATHNQCSTIPGRGRAPFGVAAAGTAYTTSSQQAWSAESVSYASLDSPNSMAGRIAQRRLQKGGSPRSAGGAGGGAMVPMGGRR